jgi:hypothetical protein
MALNAACAWTQSLGVLLCGLGGSFLLAHMVLGERLAGLRRQTRPIVDLQPKPAPQPNRPAN